MPEKHCVLHRLAIEVALANPKNEYVKIDVAKFERVKEVIDDLLASNKKTIYADREDMPNNPSDYEVIVVEDGHHNLFYPFIGP